MKIKNFLENNFLGKNSLKKITKKTILLSFTQKMHTKVIKYNNFKQ